MGYWVKLDNDTIVSFNPDSENKFTVYDNAQRWWSKAPPEIVEPAKIMFKKLGIDTDNYKGPLSLLLSAAEEEKPPKPKRKELMRRINELQLEIEGYRNQNEYIRQLRDNEVQSAMAAKHEAKDWKEKYENLVVMMEGEGYKVIGNFMEKPADK